MTRKLTMGLIVLLLTSSVWAQDVGQRRRAVRRAKGSQTLRVLNERVPELMFDETPFEQVIDWLSEHTGLNISVRWQTLEDVGIERDVPINMHVRNLRVSQLLWLIMNEAGGPDVKLAYRASGRLLVLSTAEDLSREMVTKVYDVSDLLFSIPQAEIPQMDVSQGMGQGGQGSSGGGSGGGMFQGNRGQNRQQNINTQGGTAQMAELIDIIRQTIEPDSWRENGGLGSITPFQNSIIVHNTILVHQQLGGPVSSKDIAGP